MMLTSARRDDTSSGASLLDALVGLALIAGALLLAAAVLAPALRTLSNAEAESRARERTLLEAFE
jgi:K+ transporter